MKYNTMLYVGKAKDFSVDKCKGYDKIKNKQSQEYEKNDLRQILKELDVPKNVKDFINNCI